MFLDACRRNGARNGAFPVGYRLADWAAWDDTGRYDWVIGADILSAEEAHPHLRAILERNLAPGGLALLADPFRPASLPLLEALEADGWRIALSTWSVGEAEALRSVGIYELWREPNAAIAGAASGAVPAAGASGRAEYGGDPGRLAPTYPASS